MSDENKENSTELEQLPVIPQDLQHKIKSLKTSVSDSYNQLSEKAVLYFGKGVDVAAITRKKAKSGYTDSTKFIKGKYDEVIIKPKLIALLNKTDTEKLLNGIDLMSLPANASPGTKVGVAILRNLVFVLDKYKKGLATQQETQSELNAFFNQIEMKDVFALAIPFVSKTNPQTGKVLSGIISLLIGKK